MFMMSHYSWLVLFGLISPEFAALIRAARIRRSDSSLANQLSRALTSVPLNLAEGNRRVGKDRTHLFRIAAGSAAEINACLDVAEAMGFLDSKALSESLALVDRVKTMCWRLTH
jgi:four helix bundle protein